MMERFEIHVTAEQQEDLKRRLRETRWPDSVDPNSPEAGLGLNYTKSLIGYWLNEFHWPAIEKRINAFDHFRASIDNVGIHFIHQKSGSTDAMPLLLIHGWPGSFWEMYKIIPLLIKGEKSFNVIVPSLPGYGFSDRPNTPGMNPRKIADLFAKLMEALGYDRFIVQGGDWGATVASWLCLDHPQRLNHIHLNYIPGSYMPHYEEANLTADEKAFLKSADNWYTTDGGYAHQQATRPQTLAFGLNDSPAGLAAWIVEKFRDWADCDGDVEKRFTKEELLTNVSIYWFTQTIHSSMRLYREARRMPLRLQAGQRIEVPCSVARFSKEAPMPPPEWVKRGYNVVRWTEYPSGGHFAAMEEPEALAEDIRNSVFT